MQLESHSFTGNAVSFAGLGTCGLFWNITRGLIEPFGFIYHSVRIIDGIT